MLNIVDQVIENVLDTDWPNSPPGPAKPGFYFAIPDEAWRNRVSNGTGTRLNIYLYDVHENRDFHRSNWDNIEIPGTGTAQPSMPPVYLDCHYLLSAWSATQEGESPVTSPIPDEHLILGEALRVLMRNPDVSPVSLGITGGGTIFQHPRAHVYLKTAPPEPPQALNEFWSTMKLSWRPTIHLIVTAPLDLLRDAQPGAMVTVLIQRYGQRDGVTDALLSGTLEERINIGGWVLRNGTDAPISGAVVQRIDTGGQILEETRTDLQGRFLFIGLHRGNHRLRAQAQGRGTVTRTLNLPNSRPSDHIFKLN
jgi:hypothetical protein